MCVQIYLLKSVDNMRRRYGDKKERGENNDVNAHNYDYVDSMYVQVSWWRKIRNKWGKISYCNGRSDRSPHIRGFCFPICWRCSGLIIGMIICYLMMCWGLIPPISIISISFLVIPVIVCFGDGLLQRMTNYESSNIKRFVFGVAAGYGMYCLISINN